MFVRPLHRHGPVLATLAALLLLPGVASAASHTYWFETYQHAVELIDRGQVQEAGAMLDRLIRQYPEPRSDLRVPGNQFIDYMPYFQRARVEYGQGEFQRAWQSLEVSEAFGVVRTERRYRRAVRDLRRRLAEETVRASSAE